MKDQVLVDSLLVVLLPQRRRSLLFFDGFSDESDDLALFMCVSFPLGRLLVTQI